MKLITFSLKDDPNISRIGAVKNDKIIDFYSSNLPNDMINFINLGDEGLKQASKIIDLSKTIYCHLYTSPSPRDVLRSRMPSSA